MLNLMKLIALIVLFVNVADAQFSTITIKHIDQIDNNEGTDIFLNPTNNVIMNNLTGNFALQTGPLKEIEESATTSTELGFVSGVTSAIQTQLNGKLTSPLTTEGDLIIRDASIETRLPIGTNNQILTSNGTTALWLDPAGGSASFTTVTKTAATTLATSGEDNVIADATTADFTITLPTAVGNNGLTYKISKSTAANVVTVDADGTEEIGGELTYDVESINDSIIIASDGSDWFFLSKVETEKCKTEFLSASHNSISTITDLTTDTVIGRRYRTMGSMITDSGANIEIINGVVRGRGASESGVFLSVCYTAQATTTTINHTNTTNVYGNGTATNTWVETCQLRDTTSCE